MLVWCQSVSKLKSIGTVLKKFQNLVSKVLTMVSKHSIINTSSKHSVKSKGDRTHEYLWIWKSKHQRTS